MEVGAGAEVGLTRAVALYTLVRSLSLTVEVSPRTCPRVRSDHQYGVLARLTAPGRPGEAGADAVDGLAGVSSLVLLCGLRTLQLTVRSVLLQESVGLPALVWHVAPVQPPDDLRGGNSHGGAVDDEGEALVDCDQGRGRLHNDGRSYIGNIMK